LRGAKRRLPPAFCFRKKTAGGSNLYQDIPIPLGQEGSITREVSQKLQKNIEITGLGISLSFNGGGGRI